ncbi:MAG: hypothetical protein IJV77_07360 [Clostridia bacterium]|nr:hypothetical protein [Clostridia bacterium]
MKTFLTQDQLVEHLSRCNYPSKLKDSLQFSLLAVELLRVIYVGNDKVEVILNLHRLMDVLTPMLLTVQEKRDNVAHKYKASRVRFDIDCIKFAV